MEKFLTTLGLPDTNSYFSTHPIHVPEWSTETRLMSLPSLNSLFFVSLPLSLSLSIFSHSQLQPIQVEHI